MLKKKVVSLISILLIITLVGCTAGQPPVVDENNDVVQQEENDIVTDKPQFEELTEEELDIAQKNSIAMLNYLAVITQEINSSKNSRLYLEEAYAALINNINPEKINMLSESYLSSLLDTIENYRMLTVKRERLQYLYDQNKAVAIREAIPNPLALLSFSNAVDFKRLAASVIYMGVDSYNSYNQYNDEIEQEYLQEGWALDDEESANLHESRKRVFTFMVEIVREESLPGELALNESSVEKFVDWTSNDNLHQRLQFLESEKETYKAYGGYWLELAEAYYEIGNYTKCLEAISQYETMQSDIFRKDYYYAQMIPNVIVAGSEIYSGYDYVKFAEKYLELLTSNTETSDWSLRYFAAQMYVDLYAKTNNEKYLEKAYSITLNNVNYLVEEQKDINKAYLSEVEEVKIPDDVTKAEKKDLKEYNKALKETRKKEVPTIYEPLAVNCDLLFGIADKLELSESEKKKIEGILTEDGESVFLSDTYEGRYSFENKLEIPEITFDKAEIIIPASFINSMTTVKVTVNGKDGDNTYNDWVIKRVDREESNDIDDFNVILKSKKAKKQKWSKDNIITVELIDGENYEPIVIKFKVKEHKEGLLVLPDKVEFEQVK